MQVCVFTCIALLLLTGCNVARTQSSAEGDRSESGWSIGALVPDVTMRGSDGVDYRLRDYVGKQAMVIAWYPKSFTGG